MFAVAGAALTVATVQAELSVWSSSLFTSMPSFMQEALLHSRGVDNSFPVSQAETERLLAHFVEMELKYRKKKGVYTGSFSVVSSFIGTSTYHCVASHAHIYKTGQRARTHLLRFSLADACPFLVLLILPINFTLCVLCPWIH